jgi:hypothetical protein
LALFTSTLELDTTAVFVAVPALSAATLIVTVAEAPLASVPTLHVTVAPLWEQLPAVVVADAKLTSDGSASFTVVLATLLGPLFVTLIV